MSLDDNWRKQELLGLLDKFESTLNKTLEILYATKNNNSYRDLEIMAICGDISHQLGHIPRFRSLLK